MAATAEVDRLIERWRLATGEVVKGNPRPAQELFSHAADVTLANPLGPAAPEIGPVAHGWKQVTLTQSMPPLGSPMARGSTSRSWRST